MNMATVLFLGPEKSPLLAWLRAQGEHVIQKSDAISIDDVRMQANVFIVSYGYRHIIKREVIDLLPGRAVNLHISYLPWNRGADPNLWSFIDGTPKGVTIHYIDEGVDTGDIIVQELVDLDDTTETLATSYEKLNEAVQRLFIENWSDIKAGLCPRMPQVGHGTMHRAADKDCFFRKLRDRWDTPVSLVTHALCSDSADSTAKGPHWAENDVSPCLGAPVLPHYPNSKH